MSTLKNYKKTIKKLFFMSVKNDIKKWQGGIDKYDNFISPSYKNEVYFEIRRYHRVGSTGSKNTLYLCKYSPGRLLESVKICKINSDIKVWWYVRILEKHFKKEEKDKKDITLIEYFKSGIDIVESNFIKEIRKEKIERIEK